MSAYLDKSQGITFVYSNIYDLYKQAKEAKLDSPFVAERPVAKSEGLGKIAQDQIEAREVREAQETREGKKMETPVSNLQKNLKDLSDAHEKLRFLLKELDALTKKK